MSFKSRIPHSRLYFSALLSFISQDLEPISRTDCSSYIVPVVYFYIGIFLFLCRKCVILVKLFYHWFTRYYISKSNVTVRHMLANFDDLVLKTFVKIILVGVYFIVEQLSYRTLNMFVLFLNTLRRAPIIFVYMMQGLNDWSHMDVQIMFCKYRVFSQILVVLSDVLRYIVFEENAKLIRIFDTS